ncbi:alpha/beta fold hydrolase [Streptomyces sp. NPDC057137]|uniref:alpha/beta fold hydrolase n=1 Tax=Streptomyces sp. NPDC057137 TaxID=3346030 RepID=UPI0036376EC3
MTGTAGTAQTDLRYVTSKDGTSIAYRASGAGPVLIMVSGALGTGTGPADSVIGAPLATEYTVIDFDRRGRGHSGDTEPYAVAREVEDIEALIDAHGGRAAVFGFSSGAALALAAADGLGAKVGGVALYEPPFIIDDSRPPLPADYVEQIRAAVAAGRRDQAVALFLTDAVGIPAEYVDAMKNQPAAPAAEGEIQPPSWADMEEVAHTLAYDGLVMGDTMSGKPLPTGLWSGVTAPALVICGGESDPFMRAGAKSAAGLVPHAEYRELPGQSHQFDPAALAPLLREFLADRVTR